MALRLIDPPIGLPITSIEPLSGPRSISAGSTESQMGYPQTFSSAFGAWRLQFSFAPMMDDLMRDYRGWVAEMNGGANATRWTLNDPDMIAFEAGGQAPSQDDLQFGVSWSNGEPWKVEPQDPWFNTGNWDVSHSVVPVGAAAAIDATEVRLGSAFWGHKLKRGCYLGFFPFHLGLYMITTVIAPGHYRIWPPLRKGLAADDFATLTPTLALKMEGESAASVGRGLVAGDGLTATFVEVFDYDVRDYFEG